MLTLNVAAQLELLKKQIAEACARVGRDPAGVTLVAVTKNHPVAVVQEALTAGQLDIGENYVQEMKTKVEELGSGPRWHFIGTLQRNKVKFIAPWVHLIHTVDDPRLAEEIDKRAAQVGRRIPILLQVNVAGEAAKGGCAPEQARDLALAASKLAHVEVRGLMTMPPFWPAEQVRPFFRELRRLRDQLQSETSLRLPDLSMGMSADFEVAIEEGATLIRVGTALFGAR